MEKRIDKRASRQRRAKRARMKIRELNAPRLTVHRTPRHIYAQVIHAPSTPVPAAVDGNGDRVVVQASTLDKALRNGATGNVAAAAAVGRLIAERARAAGIEAVAFDRSGYRYHGRVKALAEAAREAGLRF